MSFGLINAPSTFILLKYYVLHTFIDKCVVFYFNDPLIYRKNLDDHLQNLKLVLYELNKEKLFSNKKNTHFVWIACVSLLCCECTRNTCISGEDFCCISMVKSNKYKSSVRFPRTCQFLQQVCEVIQLFRCIVDKGRH